MKWMQTLPMTVFLAGRILPSKGTVSNGARYGQRSAWGRGNTLREPGSPDVALKLGERIFAVDLDA